MIKVSIVDDKAINRATIRQKITDYQEITIVSESSNGVAFLDTLAVSSDHPDIVLMDLEMPQMDGIETIRKCAAIFPKLKFIVVTVFEDSDKIFEAIKAGASGYILKDDSAIHIVDAITNVYEFNGVPMSPAIARKAMEMLKYGSEVGGNTVTHDYDLSTREMEILKELVSGKSYKSIGETLFISPLTVRKHVANIYEKLHVNSRVEVLKLAQKNRWL
jgi:DNA-binding NarL/FixJ family response regulator